MFTLKYDGQLQGPPPWHLDDQDVANVDFRLEQLNPSTLTERILSRVMGALREPALRFLQLLPPVRIGRLLIVTRHADVQAVLSDAASFIVHYDPEMTELGAGTGFLLAVDGCKHARQRADLLGTITNQLEAAAVDRTSEVAAALLAASGGRINVMKDYFCRVSAEAAITYLGLATDDADSFADCTLAMSAMIFGDPFGGAATRDLASHAAWRLRSIADRSIALAQSGQASGLVQALVNRKQATPAEIRATLLGLATALVPTNTLAAGKILDYLLRHRSAWQTAVEAARDPDALRKVLLEAGRLNPALNPGQFRYVPHDTHLPGSDRRIPANTVVLAATATALRDPRPYPRPGRFDPGRGTNGKPFDGDLMFGYEDHACLGQGLAIKQLVAMFEPLLKQPGLAKAPGRANTITSVGPFPRHLDMVFDTVTPSGEQTMLKIAVPCPALSNAAAVSVRSAIEALGNPVTDRALQSALQSQAIIHFAALNLIDAGPDQDVRHHLLIEVNTDGRLPAALSATVDALGPTLLPLLARCGHTTYWGHPLGAPQLSDFLSRYRVDVRLRPWGTTGLNFLGALELPLTKQADDKTISDFAARAIDLFRQLHTNGGKRAMETLRFVRAAMRPDAGAWPAIRAAALKHRPNLRRVVEGLETEARAGNFASKLVMPSAQRLAFADWQDKTSTAKLAETVLAPDMVRALTTAVLISLAAAAILLLLAGLVPPPPGTLSPLKIHVAALIDWAAWAILGVLLGAVLFVILVGAAGAGLYAMLRAHEAADRPDDRDPDFQTMTTIAARENPPGFAQNHFLSVSRFKPGPFRALTFAFALWGISLYVRFWGRPGFIEDMGTIHFAGWFRLPGTDRMVFHANFDGSWESYLEDFVTKAHIGQTAVWSNADGFPRTESLVRKGASDGDRFKRWVRRQQCPTQCWYSREPKLTLDQARTNAIIRGGLANARSDTDARAWLACFGSQQAPQDAVETDEVQSIVFTSLPTHPFGACLMLGLPATAPERTALLIDLLTGASASLPRLQFGDLVSGSQLDPVVGYLAISALGLAKFGLREPGEADGLASFQFPFNAGMASRRRVLGDGGVSDPDKWSWHDQTVDAVLWLLATDTGRRDAAVAAATARLNELHGAVLRAVPTDPVNGTSIGSGHFGFADGFSQPALRGCNGAAAAREDDVVAPGEFLFGYHNNQKCFAPSPRLRAGCDPLSLLPDTSVDGVRRFPIFQSEDEPPVFRDFGRNGTYLVIRELEQDAKGFRRHNRAHALDLKRRYPGLQAAPGVPVTAEWVAAKQIGRWPDGTPLVGRLAPPQGPALKIDDPKLNDFSYARDDPQGLHCPLGAHIRRANPRDGLQPDDPEAIAITNRHRIIRRGRSFARPSKSDGIETGLMFTAVCADLERQFEFVQQRWIGSATFQGLDESDPVLSTANGRFTIPTLDGPIRLEGVQSYVTVRGGGYFFLPSRAALCFLRDSCRIHT